MENQSYEGRRYIFACNRNYVDINPLDIGQHKCAPGFKEPPHKRPCYIFHYIVSGKGTFCAGGKEYHISKGSTFLIRPDVEVSYWADEKDPWSYIWIGFDGNMAKKLDDIDEDIFHISGEPFERMMDYGNFPNMIELFMVSCISEILCEILNDRETFNIVSMVKGYINSNNRFDATISDIADFIGVSTAHLSRTFKKETGTSLNDYITSKKMKYAKKLLNSGYKVNEIPRLVGFADPSSFSRAYKKYLGYPPSKENK